jgi:hypothetical protein
MRQQRHGCAPDGAQTGRRFRQGVMARMRGPTSGCLGGRLAGTIALAAALALPGLAACDRARIEPAQAADARTPVRLSAKEREHLRAGMRVYLESTQGIVEALAEHKMPLVAEHARKAGMSAVSNVPIWVAATLPPEFVLLGVDTHRKFDALSLAAGQARSKNEIMQHLRDILANCTACHGTYRIASDRQ